MRLETIYFYSATSLYLGAALLSRGNNSREGRVRKIRNFIFE